MLEMYYFMKPNTYTKEYYDKLEKTKRNFIVNKMNGKGKKKRK